MNPHGHSKIKLAFGSVPKDGGTFTFYRNMRPALREHGIDLRCVSVGRREASLTEAAYVDEGCVLLAYKPEDGGLRTEVSKPMESLNAHE